MSEEKVLKDEVLMPGDYIRLSLALKNLADATKVRKTEEPVDFRVSQQINKAAELIVERMKLENERLKVLSAREAFLQGEKAAEEVKKRLESEKEITPDDLPETPELT